MTQEEKQLLLKDLCARLPYGIKGLHRDKVEEIRTIDAQGSFQNYSYDAWFSIETFKPYLRPMSSMTDEEKMEWFQMKGKHCNMSGFNEIQERADFTSESLDWLNEKGFDYRGLIPMGLALEAPEGMY